MERNELQELHYITPISNVPSIMENGILSQSRASSVQHASLAMQQVQTRRASKLVPGGRPLHQYVNLYICARNPMLYKRRGQRENICVLSVSVDVLDLPGVIVTDSNASSDYARFAPAPNGLRIVDRDKVFAEYWTDTDPIQYWRKKAARCAEVLVPDQVPPRFVRGAYICCEEAKTTLDALNTGLATRTTPHLFFM